MWEGSLPRENACQSCQALAGVINGQHRVGKLFRLQPTLQASLNYVRACAAAVDRSTNCRGSFTAVRLAQPSLCLGKLPSCEWLHIRVTARTSRLQKEPLLRRSHEHHTESSSHGVQASAIEAFSWQRYFLNKQIHQSSDVWAGRPVTDCRSLLCLQYQAESTKQHGLSPQEIESKLRCNTSTCKYTVVLYRLSPSMR